MIDLGTDEISAAKGSVGGIDVEVCLCCCAGLGVAGFDLGRELDKEANAS